MHPFEKLYVAKKGCEYRRVVLFCCADSFELFVFNSNIIG